GAADGGVWKSTNRGQTWRPITDGLDSLATGALASKPADGSIWFGTGENNPAFENYAGTGLYRSTNGGSSWQKLAGTTFDSQTIGDIQFDGQGNVFVASSAGLFKASASGTGFVDVLDAAKAGFQPSPYGFSLVNSIAIQPGSGGKVIAV